MEEGMGVRTQFDSSGGIAAFEDAKRPSRFSGTSNIIPKSGGLKPLMIAAELQWRQKCRAWRERMPWQIS
jgi:hypothetical protein